MRAWGIERRVLERERGEQMERVQTVQAVQKVQNVLNGAAGSAAVERSEAVERLERGQNPKEGHRATSGAQLGAKVLKRRSVRSGHFGTLENTSMMDVQTVQIVQAVSGPGCRRFERSEAIEPRRRRLNGARRARG